ncbi:Uncharacterized protein dnm_034520 [Desulfonema magnum]|uniref:Uncharacterized protein n=1 Tax=Desulfonema magnum TaxID=45655 RepID=A0A975GN60_9BACT|nr:Uncharacterized protein dnm_034520 [Desulfonema magnum]
MTVYMKKMLGVKCQVLGKITNFLCFVMTGKSWPFIIFCKNCVNEL